MFNLQGSEIIFILLIALVVLGPEKLPGAIRRVTSLYAELRKLSGGFQDEFKSVLDEPLREMKSTADLMKNAADPKRVFEEAERESELEAAADKKARQAREVTSAMEAAGAAHLAQAAFAPAAQAESDVDAFADPVDAVLAETEAPEETVVEPGTQPGSETEAETLVAAHEPAESQAPVAELSSGDLDLELDLEAEEKSA